MNKIYYGFFAVQKPEKFNMPSFAFGNEEHVKNTALNWQNKNPVESSNNEENQEKNSDKPDVSSIDGDFTHESALTDALRSSVDFGLAQFQLIEASTIAPLIMEYAMLRSTIIGPTVNDADSLDQSDYAEIFGLDERQFADLVKRYNRFSAARRGFERFSSANLLSMVATFDTLIVDIMSKMLQLQKEWLNKSERMVSLERIACAASIEELLKEQISEELYQFSRGSHSEQATYIKRNFGIDIANDWKRWPDYIEIFERRNLVAHGEAKFNKRYVDICTKAGHKGLNKILNEDVKLTKSYLTQSLDVLIEFAALLSFSLFRKFARDSEEQAFTNLNQAAFKLIQNEKHLVAERLCGYALSLQKVKMTAEIQLMLIVNRASALRHLGCLEESKKILQSNDWSASSDLFKICVAAISEDAEEFVELLPRVKLSGSLSASDLVSWPCFSFIIENDIAKSAIEELYGMVLSQTLIGGVDEDVVDQNDIK